MLPEQPQLQIVPPMPKRRKEDRLPIGDEERDEAIRWLHGVIPMGPITCLDDIE